MNKPCQRSCEVYTCVSVFPLRKNKWLSHGQPSYKLWLSIQVFSCPYLEHIKYTSTKVSFGYRFMVVRLTTGSVCLVVPRLFGCPGRTDNKILNADVYVRNKLSY